MAKAVTKTPARKAPARKAEPMAAEAAGATAEPPLGEAPDEAQADGNTEGAAASADEVDEEARALARDAVGRFALFAHNADVHNYGRNRTLPRAPLDDAPKSGAGTKVRVTGPKGGRYRIGRQFGREPVVLEIGADELAALERDPKLMVERL